MPVCSKIINFQVGMRLCENAPTVMPIIDFISAKPTPFADPFKSLQFEACVLADGDFRRENYFISAFRRTDNDLAGVDLSGGECCQVLGSHESPATRHSSETSQNCQDSPAP